MIDPATERVVADARRLLQAVLAEEADGRAPYARDVRRFVEPQLGLPFPSFVQFLERYGFVGLDRRTDLLSVTKAGRDVVDAHAERTAGLVGDARHHFGAQLDALADAPAAPAEAEVRLSEDYFIGGCIGEGGLGTVYRGRHRATDRPVAIKLVDGLFDLFTPAHHAELRRRFELAVRAHARLVSPFIVQVLHHDPGHAPPYVVTELAPGGDLRRLLDRGPLPPSVALRYMVQVALGLKVAHQQGLYHRDLKPENVLLDAQGNAKLVDFGFARVAERDGRRVRQAYVGYGSVGYMAPELFRAGAAASPASDLYALGILLYEMLTGQLPGRRAPMPGARVEGVPQDLDDVFDRMTRDDPTERPADVDAVLTALWTSKAIVALLDARQAPLFVEPPIALEPEPEPEPEPAVDEPEPEPEPSVAEPEPEPEAAGPAQDAVDPEAEPSPPAPAPADSDEAAPDAAPPPPGEAEPAPAEGASATGDAAPPAPDGTAEHDVLNATQQLDALPEDVLADLAAHDSLQDLPLEHVRPDGVPPEARWSADDQEWIEVGAVDDAGREHGLVRYFRPDGTLCCATEHVHGVPHGAFTRYHENGQVSREGAFVEGTLHGTNVFVRSSADTTEQFPAGLGEAVWRAEMDYEQGRIVAARAFDADGNRVLPDGSAFPERPPGVPDNAEYLERVGRWVAGEAIDDQQGGLQRTGVWRWWTADGAPAEEITYVAGDREGPARTWHADGETLASETQWVGDVQSGPARVWASDGRLLRAERWADGAREGEAWVAIDPDIFADARVVAARGDFAAGQPVGRWTLLDGEDAPVTTVDYGRPFDPDLAAEVLADEARSADDWAVLGERLQTEGQRGAALIAFARAASVADDASVLDRAWADIPPRTEDAARQLAHEAAAEDHWGAIIDALPRGADAADALRALGVKLDQDERSRAALDLVHAAMLRAPERATYAFTLSLVQMSLGDAAGAEAAIETLRPVEPENADFLATYLRGLFPTFDFWPMREAPESPLENLPSAPAQPLDAVRDVAARYATRLALVRARLLDVMGDEARGMVPDVAHLLPDGPVELRRWSFEVADPDDPDDPDVVDVDETLDDDTAPPTLLRWARGDWAALCWLCWAVGLDRVALPAALEPRADYGQACGMVAHRLWYCRDKTRMRGQGARAAGVPGFIWEGHDVAGLHPNIARLAELEYAESVAVLRWLSDADARSPWQEGLRGS